MRIAIVSDVHGNFAALQAVAADLDRQSVDEVLVGGDLAQGGRQPAEVLEFLSARGWPAVLGNADQFLLRFFDGPPPLADPFAASGQWAAARLRPNHVAYLQGLPELIRRRAPSGIRFALVHATPWSITDVVLPDAPEEVAQRMLAAAHADVLAYGHIHTAYQRRVGEGLLLSAGAVGGSNDQDPRPAYLIVNLTPPVTVEVRRVTYDVDAEIAALEREGYPLERHRAESMRTGGPWPVRTPSA
ncbi:MAG: metallophosphoesterase family protein [bacterium]